MHVEERDERRRGGGLSGWRSDKNREGQEMKRREDEEYEGGNESEMKEETFKKFIFYSNKVKPRSERGQEEERRTK